MNYSTPENRNFKTAVRVTTALLFTAFTLYQIYLAITIPQARVGRVMGIASYTMITLASYFALSRNRVIRILRSVFFIAGFLLLFSFKLLNAYGIFARLDINQRPTVLSAGVYIISQLGLLIFLVYYVAFRLIKDLDSKRGLVKGIMTVLIVMFVLCLIMELFMIIRYNMNINVSLPVTVASRIMYYLGFVGTAINFMLPSSRDGEMAEYINKEQNDAEILVMSDERNSGRPDKNKEKRTYVGGDDLIMMTPDRDSKHYDKSLKKKPITDDPDFIMDTSETSSRRPDKRKKGKPITDDPDIILNSPKYDWQRETGTERMPVPDESDLIVTTPEKGSRRNAKNRKRSVTVDNSDIIFDSKENRRNR